MCLAEVSGNGTSPLLINVLSTPVCPASKANAGMQAPNILPLNFHVKKQFDLHRKRT